MGSHIERVLSVTGFDLTKLGERVLVPRAYAHFTGVSQRLAVLMDLPPGWDGYRGVPVDAVVADKVHAILSNCLSDNGRYPSIIPGPGGDVQVEWHWGGIDLEVGIGTGNVVSAWYCVDPLSEATELTYEPTFGDA